MYARPIKFKDIPSTILSEGKKNRLIFRDGGNVFYFGGFINKKLVCLTCLVINKNKTASIKSNFTLTEHRGKGYFTRLNRHCLGYAREHGVKNIHLNCLEDSVNIHLRAGAEIWKKTKVITWMVYKEGY
jgi:predicted GNAT family acetyltransferase